MSDNEREDGHLRPAPSDAAQIGSVRGDDASFDATAALLRLLIGVLLVGTDELRSRVERWEASAASARSSQVPQTTSDSPRYPPLSESVRRAFVGMLFDTETRTRLRLSAMAGRLARFSATAEYVFATRFEPAIRQTPFNPVLVRVDEALFTAMDTLDRWSARGGFEEQQGRALAQHALASMADELLDYMSRNPQVRALIERQGASMAGDAIDEVRDRTASADTRFERFAHGLLHRPTRDVAAETAPSMAASPSGDAGG
jgi:hypothetical protein